MNNVALNDVVFENMYLIGIDIGTGSIKVVKSDMAGNPLDMAQYPYPLDQSQKDFFEQDPEAIWDAFVLSIQNIVANSQDEPMAISLSCAMHSLILVDDKGAALYPMLTWADARSGEIATRLRESPEGKQIYESTGTPIHPMSPLCKIIWFKEHRPDLFNKTYKFISVKEYIWYKLFGCFEIDYSIASATGLFDIKTLQWSTLPCALAGIHTNQLSTPVDTVYIRRNINAQMAALLNLPVNTAFVIGAGDGCCANLGSGVMQPGTAAITIGTSGAVRLTGPVPVYNYPVMTFNYLLNKNTFVSGGAINNGGIAVKWLLENFMEQPGDYQQLFDTIAQVPAGSNGLIFLPYVYGERAPIWDAKSSGAYLNIKPEHTRAHFLKAALEGICYALCDVLRELEQVSGNVGQVSVSGGFTSSPVWMQILADVTGKRLVTVQVEDASATGAIYLAIKALFPHAELPQSTAGTVIHANMDHHLIYSKTFPLFKKLYADLKESMHTLNQMNLT
jgi:gluconokinase